MHSVKKKYYKVQIFQEGQNISTLSKKLEDFFQTMWPTLNTTDFKFVEFLITYVEFLIT